MKGSNNNLFCNRCRYKNVDGAKFCKGCGEEIISCGDGTLAQGVILDKRYEIVRMVKAGGMGAVYEALDHRFKNKQCAVKEMLNLSKNPDELEYFIESFKKEAKTLYHLKHPSLPGVKDYFIENGRYYLVMDYIEGRDLQSVMTGYEGNKVPPITVMKWAIEILDVLDYLHNQPIPIVYRDLKPGNIMLRSLDEKIILIDFGIARTVKPGSKTLKTGIGTPVFSPKEVFLGQPEPRSDIYSLGATMHCLLTGVVPVIPYSFESAREHSPELNAELDNIVMRALSMEISTRYSSAKEMKKAILHIYSPPSTISTQVKGPLIEPTIKSRPVEDICEPTIKSSPVEDICEPTIKSRPVEDICEPTIKSRPVEDICEPTIKSSPVEDIYKDTSVAPVTKEPSSQKNLVTYNKKNYILPIVIILVLLLSLSYIFLKPFYEKTRKSHFVDMGNKLSDEENYSEAIKYFNRALKIDNDDHDILNKKKELLKYLGDNMFDEEKYKVAITYYDNILDIDPENTYVWQKKGECLFKTKNYNEAFICYDKALELTPDDINSLYMKGWILHTQENYNEAIKWYNELLKIAPESTLPLYSKALSLYNLGNYDDAVQYYDETLELDPSYMLAWNGRGEALYSLGNYKEAVKAFDNAIELDPNFSILWYNRGDSLYGQGKYEEALQSYDSAIQIKPDYIRAINNKGVCLYSLGNYKEAIKCFDKILDIDPHNDEAKTNKEISSKAISGQ